MQNPTDNSFILAQFDSWSFQQQEQKIQAGLGTDLIWSDWYDDQYGRQGQGNSKWKHWIQFKCLKIMLYLKNLFYFCLSFSFKHVSSLYIKNIMIIFIWFVEYVHGAFPTTKSHFLKHSYELFPPFNMDLNPNTFSFTLIYFTNSIFHANFP